MKKIISKCFVCNKLKLFLLLDDYLGRGVCLGCSEKLLKLLPIINDQKGILENEKYNLGIQINEWIDIAKTLSDKMDLYVEANQKLSAALYVATEQIRMLQILEQTDPYSLNFYKKKIKN